MNRNNSYEKGSNVTLLKVIIYGAVIFLTAIFQSTVASRFGFFGATPAIMLALTCGAACYEDERVSSVIGLASGFCADALGNSGVSILPLVYALVGWFGTRLAVTLGKGRDGSSVGGRLIVWTLMLAGACGIGMLTTAITLLLTADRVYIIDMFLHILLPELAGTFVFGYPVGVIYMIVYRKRK